MSIKRWMAKKNVVYLHSGTLFSHKMEWSTDTCYNKDEPQIVMWSERSQSQKAIYCMIPFIQSVQHREIHRNWKQISRCQKGGGKGERLLMGTGYSFGGDENVLELVVIVAQLCEYVKNHWIVHFG